MHDPASDFEQFRALADELAPYAVEFRYPDTLPLVPLEPVQAAADTVGHRFLIAFLSEFDLTPYLFAAIM
jgi:hypothetical protein